jgi:F0F1-type ATP synthase assembly protein I
MTVFYEVFTLFCYAYLGINLLTVSAVPLIHIILLIIGAGAFTLFIYKKGHRKLSKTTITQSNVSPVDLDNGIYNLI